MPEAIVQFEIAAKINPGSITAHYDLAGALMTAGRLPEAILQYRQVLRLRPDFGDAHLGRALRASGRIEEAAAEFEKAGR